MEIIHVQSLRSGGIVIDGSASTLVELNAKLTHIKSVKGVVFYYRENPDEEPTESQLLTFKTVVDARVAVSFSTKADFSDYVGTDGQSHPRN